MKIKRSTSLLLTLVCITLSCSKSAPTAPQESPEVPAPVVNPPDKQTLFLPVKLEATGHSIVFKYQAKTNLLVSIADSKGLTTNIKYNADGMITGYQHQENNKETYNCDYWSQPGQPVHEIFKFKADGKISRPDGSYALVYNSLKQLSEASSYAPNKDVISRTLFTYDSNGLLGQRSVESTKDEQHNYTYDQKNGIFKYVQHLDLLALDMYAQFFYSRQHNVLSVTGTDSAYSYEYNADDFPSKVTLNTKGSSTVFRVTYKAP